jgi:hypothetical protein
MTQENELRLASLARRRNLGLALVVLGLVPMLALMAHIVIDRHPSGLVIVGTIACWLVFFAGKTILKTATLASARLRGEQDTADVAG